MKWLISKTIWGAIALGILGLIEIAEGDYQAGFQKLAEALVVVGVRHGIWKAVS